MNNKIINLPDTLPSFIVSDILLLPGGHAPMHLVSNGDINVILDSLVTPSRLVGIALEDYNNSSHYKHGCAGKITSFDEMSDGSFFVTLTGTSRFKIEKEVPNIRSYKRFSVNWDSYEDDMHIDPTPNIGRDDLVNMIKEYAEKFAIDMDWEVLSDMPNFNIITFFAMSIPFDNPDRQKLLEAKNVEKRAEILSQLLQEQLSR